MPKLTGLPKVRMYANRAGDWAYLSARMHYVNKTDRRRCIFKMAVGEKVLFAYWDKKSQRIQGLPDLEEQQRINDKINAHIRAIETVYRDFDGRLSPDLMRIEVDKLLGLYVDPTPHHRSDVYLLEFAKVWHQRRKEQAVLKKNTHRNPHNFIQLLGRYEKLKNKRIKWDDVDKDFWDSFLTWMNNTKYSLNYSSRMLRLLKQIMREAEQKGLHSNKRYESLKARRVSGSFITLEESELDKLQQMELDGELSRARDFFLMSAFTGQRFSDVKRIVPEMVVTRQGIQFIELTQEKTGAPVMLPVIAPAFIELMEQNNWTAPKLRNQTTYNKLLKELGKLLWGEDAKQRVKRTQGGQERDEFLPKWTLLSSHCGRRTFATIHYRAGIYSLNELMAITGHKTEAEFKKYIGLDRQDYAMGFAHKQKLHYKNSKK